MFAGLTPASIWGMRADMRAYEAATATTPCHGAADAAMATARTLLAARGLAMHNMPYDGSCLMWALLPYMRRRLMRRPLSVNEARQVLVTAMGAPSLRADLQQDLVQHNLSDAVPLADTDALLAVFRRPGAYMNAILAAKAIEMLTGDSLRIFFIVGGNELAVLYESDAGAPFSVEIVFEPRIEHYALVVPAPPFVLEADGPEI